MIGPHSPVMKSILLTIATLVLFQCPLNPLSAQSTDAGQGSQATGDTVRPRLIVDGQIKVPGVGYDINLYRGIGSDTSGDDEVSSDTPYFFEPIIRFQKDTDGRFLARFDDQHPLTLYAMMDSDQEAMEHIVKTYLREKKGLSRDNMPRDGNIQPLSVQGWFESSLDPTIRSIPGNVTTWSRSGADVLVHFPDLTGQAARRFLADLHEGRVQLIFQYSLVGDVIEYCWVTVSFGMISKNKRFIELTGDASTDERTGGVVTPFVSRHQVADLIGDLHETKRVTARCGSPETARALIDLGLNKLGEPEEQFTIDHLDLATAQVQDDLRADIDATIDKIEASETRSQLQLLRLELESGATSVGAVLSAVVELIPFTAKATVDDSHSEADAFQFLWDKLRRFHDQLEWDGKRYHPKKLEVFRKETLKNKWRQGLEVRQETVKRAKELRSLTMPPVRPTNWPSFEASPDGRKVLRELRMRLRNVEDRLAWLPARESEPGIGVRVQDSVIEFKARANADESRRGSGERPRLGVEAPPGGDLALVTRAAKRPAGSPRTTPQRLGRVELRARGGTVEIAASDVAHRDSRGELTRKGGSVSVSAGSKLTLKSQNGDIQIDANRRSRRGGNGPKGDLKLKADGAVKISATKGIYVNDEPFLLVKACTYEFTGPKESGRYYIHSGRNEDMAVVSGWSGACNDSVEAVDVARARRDGPWVMELMVGRACEHGRVQLVFLTGFGATRNTTYYSRPPGNDRFLKHRQVTGSGCGQ